jgi:hypothetical protein
MSTMDPELIAVVGTTPPRDPQEDIGFLRTLRSNRATATHRP